MIDLREAEGQQHMTLPLPAATDIQRCSLGVVEELEEVNNIAAAAAGPLSPVFLGGKATHGVRAGRGRVRL